MNKSPVELDEATIKKIADHYQTPLYVFNADILRRQYHRLRQALSSHIDIFYSMKANPNLTICRYMCNMQTGIEVCSIFELQLAMQAGFEPENIIFIGPYKSENALRQCIELNVRAIVCESRSEIIKVSEFAKNCQRTANVMIRVNPNFICLAASLKMGGVPTQFGIEQTELFEDSAFFLNMPHMKIVGIHIYNANRVLSEKAIAANTDQILNLIDRLSVHWKMEFKYAGIGGGLGVAYFEDEKDLDLNLLSSLMGPVTERFSTKYPNTQMLLESGRFLVAESGIFIGRIGAMKEIYGKDFLVTDGGFNCHLTAIAPNFPICRHFPLSLVTYKESKGRKKYCVAGPLCTPHDIFAFDLDLPIPEIGDLVVVHRSGGYGLTASPVLFLSQARPVEVMYDKGKTSLIRSRPIYEKFTEDQIKIQEIEWETL